MPGNEFEKQVQSKMEDFQLDPSASVWHNVEKEIRKKKKRRIILFLILPAALVLLGYSIYYFANNNQRTEIARQSDGNNENAQLPVPKKTQTLAKENNSGQIKPGKDEPSMLETARLQNQTTGTPKNTRGLVVITASTNANSRTFDKQDKTGILAERPEKDEPQMIAKNIPGKTIEAPVPEENKAIRKEAAPVGAEEPMIGGDSIALNEIKAAPPEADRSVDSAIRETKMEEFQQKKKSHSTMKWGIDLSAGLMANNEGMFSFAFGSASKSQGSSYSASASGSSAVIISPSSITSGPSFRIGVAGELQVSRKSRFSTGLQYIYASNHIRTGSKIDTFIRILNPFTVAVDQYYTGSRQNNYTNRFHFIQVPLWYHWQFNKGKKLPLQWNVGASFNYLVGTNGLVYDTLRGGIYYLNRKAFNKAYVNLMTGFSTRIIGKNRWEWVLGPELSFNTSRLIDNPYERKQYLMYTGFSARLLFPGKKK